MVNIEMGKYLKLLSILYKTEFVINYKDLEVIYCLFIHWSKRKQRQQQDNPPKSR